MLKVFYGKNGKPYSDFSVETFLSDIIKKHDFKNENYEINASTENVVFAVRVAIRKGDLDFSHVVVYSDDGQAFKFNKDGKFLNGNYVESYLENALDVLIGITN